MFDKNRPQCIIPLGSVVCLDCDWCPISFLPKVATCSHDILREVPELLGISRGEKLPSFFQMIFIFPFLWCSNLMSFWLVFRNSKILRLGLFLIAFFSLYYILKLGLFGGNGVQILGAFILSILRICSVLLLFHQQSRAFMLAW